MTADSVPAGLRGVEDLDLRESLQGLSQLVMYPYGLTDTLKRVADFAVSAIPGADGVGLTLFQGDRPDTVVASADFVRDADALQYLLGEGPCIIAVTAGHPVRTGHLDTDDRFRRFGPQVAKMGLHSMLSLPLLTHEDAVLGSINVYAYAADAFDDRAEELGVLFASPAAISVQNAQALSQAQRLAATMQAALNAEATQARVAAAVAAAAQSGRDLSATVAGAATAGRQVRWTDAANDQMVSRINHEFRTPLNEILGFAQLLELDELSPDQHASVAHVISGGRRLLAMIDDLLDMNSARADQLPLVLEPVRVDDLIADVIVELQPAVSVAGLDIGTSTVPPNAVHTARADRRRLRQVVFTVVSNAVKYTHRGGRVHIHTTADPGHIMIAVEDNGPGIAAQNLQRVFMPFDRIDQTSANNGVGIGLAVSQRLIRQMAGTLIAQSTLGRGSTFTITVPLSRDMDLPA